MILLLLEEELQGFNTVTFFMDGKMKYFVVYLEPEGNSIKVKGNALYPGLMEVKGNRINEELTALRKDLTPLLSEYQTLRNKITGKNKKNGIEEADFISRQANIRLQIMEKIKPDDQPTTCVPRERSLRFDALVITTSETPASIVANALSSFGIIPPDTMPLSFNPA